MLYVLKIRWRVYMYTGIFSDIDVHKCAYLFQTLNHVWEWSMDKGSHYTMCSI